MASPDKTVLALGPDGRRSSIARRCCDVVGNVGVQGGVGVMRATGDLSPCAAMLGVGIESLRGAE
jgi:hypothetical protein